MSKPEPHEIQRLLASRMLPDVITRCNELQLAISAHTVDQIKDALIKSAMKHTRVSYEKVSSTRYRAVLELKELKR